jgi:hypothetical protein
MFETLKRGMSREVSTLIAVHHVQPDLRAGFTAARDLTSHGNGHADVDMREAINRGMLEGPPLQVGPRDHPGGHRARARDDAARPCGCSRSRRRVKLVMQGGRIVRDDLAGPRPRRDRGTVASPEWRLMDERLHAIAAARVQCNKTRVALRFARN